MTKKILIGVVAAVIGLVAFTWFTTGEVALIPTQQLSAEARQLDRLQGQFATATHNFYQAGRAAGVSGMDTTSAAQAAIEDLNRIEEELLRMKANNPPQVEMEKIEKLLSDVRKVKNS